MNRWRAIASAAMILLAGVIGCRSEGLRGSGRAKTETRALEGFSQIAVGGAYKLEVKVGAAKQVVRVTADDNLLPLIRTEVKGGRLEVTSGRKPLRPRVGPRLAIEVPRLESLAISGAASGKIEGIRGERFAVKVSGAGKLSLAGEVKNLRTEVSGAASIDAGALAASFVEVEGSGAVNVTVRASQSLTATVSGAGKVAYFGQPKQVKQSLSGVAKLVDKGP